MKIYHFCSNKDARSIFRDGITIGGVLIPATGQIVSGYMWLTLDGNSKNQSWATRNLIPYSRTVWRFTVDIPEEYAYRIMGRKELAEKFPSTEMLFDGWDGSENWRVYKGEIPTKWIQAVERMEDA